MQKIFTRLEKLARTSVIIFFFALFFIKRYVHIIMQRWRDWSHDLLSKEGPNNSWNEKPILNTDKLTSRLLYMRV